LVTLKIKSTPEIWTQSELEKTSEERTTKQQEPTDKITRNEQTTLTTKSKLPETNTEKWVTKTKSTAPSMAANQSNKTVSIISIKTTVSISKTFSTNTSTFVTAIM
jgi:hypothetical protein